MHILISKQIRDSSTYDYYSGLIYARQVRPEPGARFVRAGVAWARLVSRVTSKWTPDRVQEPSHPDNLSPGLQPIHTIQRVQDPREGRQKGRLVTIFETE